MSSMPERAKRLYGNVDSANLYLIKKRIAMQLNNNNSSINLFSFLVLFCFIAFHFISCVSVPIVIALRSDVSVIRSSIVIVITVIVLFLLAVFSSAFVSREVAFGRLGLWSSRIRVRSRASLLGRSLARSRTLSRRWSITSATPLASMRHRRRSSWITPIHRLKANRIILRVKDTPVFRSPNFSKPIRAASCGRRK